MCREVSKEDYYGTLKSGKNESAKGEWSVSTLLYCVEKVTEYRVNSNQDCSLIKDFVCLFDKCGTIVQ